MLVVATITFLILFSAQTAFIAFLSVNGHDRLTYDDNFFTKLSYKLQESHSIVLIIIFAKHINCFYLKICMTVLFMVI